MNRVIIEGQKLQHNIEIVKEKVNGIVDDNGKKLTIIGVVKGNGYGIGILNLAKKLIDNNIKFFAVSNIEEARVLRENDFDNPILLLKSTAVESQIDDIINLNLIPSVGSIDAAKALNKRAEERNKTLEAHLKIDTGFGRFGFIANSGTGEYLTSLIYELKNIKITGMYSHFSESYSKSKKTTEKQFNKFIDLVAELKKNNVDVGMLHICNSPAFFKYRNMYLNAVRIGSAFVGKVQIDDVTGLQPVGYLESTVCEIKELPKGYRVGYSGTEKLKSDTRVAIIEAGYADGFGVSGKKDDKRLLDKLRLIKNVLSSPKNKLGDYVEVNNTKCPVIGRISMKNTVVDVTNVKDVKVGDMVKMKVNLLYVDSSVPRVEI